jgi:hypothetical protein
MRWRTKAEFYTPGRYGEHTPLYSERYVKAVSGRHRRSGSCKDMV